MAALSLVDVFTAPGFDLESIKQPIPLVLAMPEPKTKLRQMTSKLLIKHMIELSGAPIDRNQIHCLHTGRAAGIEGLNLAYRYLDDLKHDYVLLGGSDSYQDLSLLDMLEQRLLVAGNGDGFAPGEGAGFLLLTRHPENALAYNGHHVTVNLPGIAEEQGHFYSEKAYQGNGLDLAFKQALKSHTNLPISRIYSSMNGENFWAKEYGVAYLRNKEHFVDNVIVEHPADCYGDLGVATGSVLIGLSAMQLLKSDEMNPHLVYSSSDLATRGAVLLEKGVIQ
jgi:3-oxoacyl-[acyl-carrier-protein] synthase-1